MAMVLKRAARLPFAPIAAGLFALSAAILVMATPIWMLETLADRTGISSAISAAQPPLGMKARALLAIVAAFATGVVFWLALLPIARLFEKKRSRTVRPFVPADQPSDAVADAHVATADLTASRRGPIFAERDLGAPFMSDLALDEAPVASEADELVLDAAIPPTLSIAEPAPAPEAEQAAQPIAPPIMPPLPEAAIVSAPTAIPVPPPADDFANCSITDLIERLEYGMQQRASAISVAKIAATALAATPIDQAAGYAAATEAQGAARRPFDSALDQALSTLERLAASSR